MKGKIDLKFVCMSLILIFLTLSVGCNVDSVKSKFNGKDDSLISIDSDDLDGITQDVSEIGQTEIAVDSEQETLKVELWFASGDGNNLMKETREITKVEGIARNTVNELLKGPSSESNLLPTVPVGTKLNDINVKEDGLIIVDFSKELIENHVGDSKAETLTVNSIVNTLCQFPTVNGVQLLVDGKYVETLAGNVDVSTVLTPEVKSQ